MSDEKIENNDKVLNSKVQNQQGRQSKVIVIIVTILVAALLYIAYSYFTKPSDKDASYVASIRNQRGEEGKESEHYSNVLNTYNKQESEKAEEEKKTYLSVLSSNPTDVPTQEKIPLPPPVIPVETQYQQQPVQQPQQPQQQEQQVDQQLINQVDGLVQTWIAKPHTAARVAQDGENYVKTLSVGSSNNVSGTNIANLEKVASNKLIEDYALIPAILNTDLDTDENSLVSVLVPFGELKGAVLYASGYKRLTNTIDMTFTAMKFQGKSYSITAKPIDQNTNRSSLSGEVSNRYFTRVIIPAVAAGLGKAGQLYAQGSSQNIITNQGAVVQTYPATPDARAVGGTIAGGIAEQSAKVLESDAETLPIKRVLIPKGTTIGIQFIGSISLDEKSEKSGLGV